MKKIGIIDIGSNSARLVLVSMYDNGSFRICDELKESVRLISDMDSDNIIKPRRVLQLIKTLQMFKRLCDANGVEQIIPVLSAAIRKAANQRSFLDEVFATTGINLTLLTGEQEAQYVYQGVINSMDIDAGIIMDIGGGTTELIHFEKRNMKNLVSLPFGTVTLTELFGLHDQVTDEQVTALEEFIKQQFDEVPWLKNLSNLPLIGVGGSFRNVGKIVRKKNKYSMDLAHNYRITKKDVSDVYQGIRKLDLDRRMKIKGLSNERADIFTAAVVAIEAAANYTNCGDILISCTGLREGIMYETLNPVLAQKPVSDVLEFSLNNVSGMFNENPDHARRVTTLALSLFEQLRQLHKLPNSYMRIIRAAGMLHDIGIPINYYNHQKNTFYMILNCYVFGLAHREHLMSAFVASLHRKNEIRRDYIKFSDVLRSEDIDVIQKLAVLIRMAESFDRCMAGTVQSVSCDILGDSVIIKTQAIADASLEIKDALTSSDMFKKAYGKNLVIL